MKQRAFFPAILAQLNQVEHNASQPATEQRERRWRDRLSPLDDRLRRILDNIPNSIKAEGVRLPPLVHQLAGRTRQHPSQGDVGKALRRLGWRRRRDWSNGDEGYPAVCYPPTTKHENDNGELLKSSRASRHPLPRRQRANPRPAVPQRTA